MKISIVQCVAILLAPTLHLSAQVIVDDNWADGDRTKTESPDPLDADWWSSNNSSGNSIEVESGGLGLVSGSSGRGIHGTFTPQNLVVGDILVATCTFTTPATVGTNRGTAFRIAMMDFNDPGLAADLNSSSDAANPLYTSLPGYMVDFDVNKTDMTDNISVRAHETPNEGGQFLGTTNEWEFVGNSSTGAGGYTILPNTKYVAVMSLTKTSEDGMDIFASLSQGSTVLVSHTQEDDSGLAIPNNFGMLGYWVTSNTFGSTTDADPDNGITFSNITVELNPQPEPEPEFDLRITSIDYDEDAESVTIEWNAEVGTTYFLYASSDLIRWDEELGDLTADATTESFTEGGVSAGRRYYRVVSVEE